MTISVLKMHFRKLPPKIISYRDFKKFDNERFMDSLQHTLGQESFDLSKTLINFITFVIQYLTPMRRIRKIIYVGIINLLSLNPIQKLSYKEHALETSFWKTLTTKINYSITNKEIFVSLLRKQTKEYLQD